jgi:cytochrome b561
MKGLLEPERGTVRWVEKSMALTVKDRIAAQCRGNAGPGFTASAKWLHWLSAFLMLSLIPVAFSFAWTDRAERAQAIPVHASIGMIVLLLTLIRLGYRAVVAPPPVPASTPRWMKLGAALGHLAIYGLILFQAALGILMAAASPSGIRFFNSWNLAALAPANPEMIAALLPWHFAGAVALAMVLAGHVSAALWHGLMLRDGVMSRMLPFSGLAGRLWREGSIPAWRFPSQMLKHWPK